MVQLLRLLRKSCILSQNGGVRGEWKTQNKNLWTRKDIEARRLNIYKLDSGL